MFPVLHRIYNNKHGLVAEGNCALQSGYHKSKASWTKIKPGVWAGFQRWDPITGDERKGAE